MRRAIALGLSALAAAATLALVGWIVLNPQAARAHFLAEREFAVHQDRYLVAPETSAEALRALDEIVRAAEGRIVELFGEKRADPLFIVIDEAEGVLRYSPNTYATIHANPLGRSYVVVGPNGLDSVDVVAHELAHAEHLERVGFGVWWLTPSWFLEGVAMQADQRPKYDDAAIEAAPPDSKEEREICEKYTYAAFASGDLALTYAFARKKVADLLRPLGPHALERLLQEQRLGLDLVAELERACRSV